MTRGWHRLVRRLRGVFSRREAGRVHDELQLHLDLLADEYRAQGMAEDEARARANREFGNATRVAERTREVTTLPWLEGVIKDLVYGARQLRRSPLVTGLAVASLAVGIGANTAIFSIVNALVLRTLPVPAPDRLASLSGGDDAVSPVDGWRWSYRFWRAFAEHRDRFAGVMAWSPTRLSATVAGATDSVDGVYVDGRFFETVQVPAWLGRTLTAADDAPGAAPVVVLGHGAWQRWFGGTADVIGRTVTLQDTPFTVVGVLPPAFTGLDVGTGLDVALPIAAEALIRSTQSFIMPPFDGMNMWLRLGVRLAPGQSIDDGLAVVRGLQPQLREASIPDGFPQLREVLLKEPIGLAPAATGLSRLRQLYRRPLDVLAVVVGLVLLLACVNVANLLLAQATAREHELGVRLALGGSRWRVARQLLAESAWLTAAGVTAGLALAAWASRALVAQFADANTRITLDLGLDARVLLVTAIVAVITTFVCGTAAAWRVNTLAPAHALTDAARGTVGGRRARLPQWLLAGQVTLSLTLVVGTGLFVGTFLRLTSLPAGFDRDAVLVATVNAARTTVAPEQRLAVYLRVVEAVRAVPGVQHVSASSMTPVSASRAPILVRPQGAAAAVEGEAQSMFVTPGWFATYGVTFNAGRDVAAGDTARTSPVMVVNRAFAERFFPGRDAVGEIAALAVGRRGEVTLQTRTIVGVVHNAAYWSLRETPPPIAYVPLAQYDYPIPMAAFTSISVRATAGAPEVLTKPVTAAIATVDPRLTVTARTLASQVLGSIRQERVLAAMSALFGAVALFLAATGLFGVMSYSVARRRGEIAVRVAVGASPRDVVRSVLSRVAWPLVAGVIAGVALSTWLARLVAYLFFGVTPGDPVTLAVAIAMLVATALAAAWIPARRALAIDPVDVLRTS